MAAEDAMSEEGESKAEPMVEDVSVVDAEPMDGARCGARLVLSSRQRASSALKQRPSATCVSYAGDPFTAQR